jgi:tetratricopeptide (TPR) repeat protein
MVRNGLIVFVGAALLFGSMPPTSRAADEEAEGKENRLRTQLAVQTALQQGRDNLQRGNYQAAVYCLENQISRVDGNRDYLSALREAYRGYIRELHQANRYSEARTYQERLKILDPGYQLELNTGRPANPPTIASLASQSASPPPAKPQPAIAENSKPAANYTARPQMPDDHDPFADGNSAQPGEVREALDRAKQEFDRKNYAAANRLFEQAHRLDPRALAPYGDLWAHGKLYAVVEATNKSGGTPPANAEKEILAALALTVSPKLEQYGKDILRTIQDRRIEVRHIPARDNNWPEAETTNFRVIHKQSRELAEQVARIAETTRAEMTRKWFGEEPAPWPTKCRIILYATARDYAGGTRQPADSPGHSTLKREGDGVFDRRIDLHCDVKDMLTNVLPKETTHAVLWGRFGPHMAPRWADEGVALLSEQREKIDLYLKLLPGCRSRREQFTASELMNSKDWPEARRIGAFYGQSISLVEFLSSQKGGHQEFIRFLRDGIENGYEAALRRHYGFRDFGDLEQRWSQSISGDTSATAALYAPGR